jgi:hypothetical protein
MVTALAPCAGLKRKVRERVRHGDSKRQVAEVLTAIAVNAVHPARHLGVGRSASNAMLEDPIERTTDAAVEMLIARLEELVDTLPRSTLEQLESEQLVAELGQE